MARVRLLLVSLCVVVLPASAFAQASITGVVRDASGAVLPGVTVEAASPALIEKVRTASTDGTGQYRLTDLRPGTYAVTFTLPGFSTVAREGLELSGTLTAVVNAEMRVGAVEETITVTGAAPVVDVQSVNRQTVITNQIVSELPTARNFYNIAVLIPGVTAPVGARDVGGAAADGFGIRVNAHGSRDEGMRFTVGGLNFGNLVGPGGNGAITSPNLNAMQEVSIDVAAVDASAPNGGVRILLVPKEGGNTFSGTFFLTGTNDNLQSSNLDDALRRDGLTTVNEVRYSYDISAGIGGPLQRDKIWFYFTGRRNSVRNVVAGAFYNKNANDPTKWTYEPDLARPYITETSLTNGTARITWQATPKNKFSLNFDETNRCNCGPSVNRFTPPEAATYLASKSAHYWLLDWSSPVTNRLLLEAGGILRRDPAFTIWQFNPPLNYREMISVQEQSTGLRFRAPAGVGDSTPKNFYYRGAASYITGAHALKVGFQAGQGESRIWSHDLDMNYRVNNGVANQLTMRAVPFDTIVKLKEDLGIFAQERWTLGRMTLSGAVRYDYLHYGWPDIYLGPTRFTPNRNITLPAGTSIKYHDITPRVGASYDLRGDGRTAVKVSLNKYLQGFGAQSSYPTSVNPVTRLVSSVNRAWTDNDRDYVADCDLLNPAAQSPTTTGSIDTCGPWSSLAFGTTIPGQSFDPEILAGWGSRGFNWEFTGSVQHELVTGTAINVGYFRRWYGNLTVTDNRALTAADFDAFSITAPAHPELPGGGGYTLSGLYNVRPDKFSLPTDNYETFAKNYGDVVDMWHGVDVTLTSRTSWGLTAQGGFSTGRQITDRCEVAAKLPETNVGAVLTPLQFCRQVQPFQTQYKGFGSYTVPKVDVLFAMTVSSEPGQLMTANYVASNTVIGPSLSRPLSGGAANATIALVGSNELYYERLNPVDIRVSKLLRLGTRRIMLGVDLYNAFNGNTVVGFSNNFGNWLAPTTIQQARVLKFSGQVDF